MGMKFYYALPVNEESIELITPKLRIINPDKEYIPSHQNRRLAHVKLTLVIGSSERQDVLKIEDLDGRMT